MRSAAVWLVAAFLGACASAPDRVPEPVTEIPPIPAPALPPPVVTDAPPGRGPQTGSVAVASLMKNARDDLSAGRLANAAASLERALRIEPRNPRLWHELALVRLRQGQYVQAASLAARSNTYAGDDPALRAENARIIEEAKQNRR